MSKVLDFTVFFKHIFAVQQVPSVPIKLILKWLYIVVHLGQT